MMTTTQPDGYLALPPGGKGEGVLVLHAWWGLNEAIKDFCRRLADSGFTAFAPDLYHGKVVDTIPEAEAMVKAFDGNFLQRKVEIAQAVAFLNEQSDQPGPGLAVIAFSMGVYYALELSNSDPEHIRSVVIFYGTGDEGFSDSKASYLGHFAENDPFEPRSGVDDLEQSIRQAGRPVTFYHYPGTGHWFFEPDRVDAYNEEAARLAWERTLEFLRRVSP
jgi:carboxymethylenebutenolidase